MTGRKLSEEHLAKLRKHLAKLNPIVNARKGIAVKVTNVVTGEISVYSTIRAVTESMLKSLIQVRLQ